MKLIQIIYIFIFFYFLILFIYSYSTKYSQKIQFLYATLTIILLLPPFFVILLRSYNLCSILAFAFYGLKEGSDLKGVEALKNMGEILSNCLL